MKLNDGKIHKILFTNGNLFLDGVQIGGQGINPPKDILFEFQSSDGKEEKEIKLEIPKDVSEEVPEFLEINVHDAIPTADIGPGQR